MTAGRRDGRLPSATSRPTKDDQMQMQVTRDSNRATIRLENFEVKAEVEADVEVVSILLMRKMTTVTVTLPCRDALVLAEAITRAVQSEEGSA